MLDLKENTWKMVGQLTLKWKKYKYCTMNCVTFFPERTEFCLEKHNKKFVPLINPPLHVKLDLIKLFV